MFALILYNFQMTKNREQKKAEQTAIRFVDACTYVSQFKSNTVGMSRAGLG